MSRKIRNTIKNGRSKNIKVHKKHINVYTIRRLSLYLEDLKRLQRSGVKIISSSRIPDILDVSPAQFRKDLSFFGEFGKRGVGYNVDCLVQEIEKILGTNIPWDIALIGLGRLGSALISYVGFAQFNLRITAAFENDKRKIGRTYNGIKVEEVKDIKRIVNARGIEVAMLCVPTEAVSEVMQLLQGSKIRAILNFTSVNLKKEKRLFVSNVNMSGELQTLIYLLRNTKRQG